MSSDRVAVVAIDGPVGVGKSSVASRVAQAMDFRHLDTGAMYRCVALHVLREAGNSPSDHEISQLASELTIDFSESGLVFLNGEDVSEDIRDESVSTFVSVVADHRAVREALVAQQRRIGLQSPSVLEGRDIGTVVFPDAACKIYLDAAPKVRAQRRVDQLAAMGKQAKLEEVYHNLVDRDQRDRSREWGALCRAADADLIDTTEFTEDQVVELICELVRSFNAFHLSMAGTRETGS